MHASKGGRAAVFLETKIWISDYGYDETLHAFDKSAGKLGVDQIDLLILHQALPSDFGKTLEAYRALETLLKDGKVRAIGVSNFMVEHLTNLIIATYLSLAGRYHGQVCYELPDERTCAGWRNVFARLADGQPDIRQGVHVTSPSILLEDTRWLAGQGGRQFVDPEIGHMGRAAASSGIEFGFLHVVSNNLAAVYRTDLSNERLSYVVERRAQLLDRIHEIIRLRLQAIPRCSPAGGTHP